MAKEKCNMCREELPRGHVYLTLTPLSRVFSKKATWVCWGCLAEIIEQCKDRTKGVQVKSGFSRECEIVPIEE